MGAAWEWALERDRFASPISLNFGGKSEIGTIPGLLCTLICYFIVVVFGIQRYQTWYYRMGTDVAIQIQADYFTAEETIDLKDLGLKFAVALVDYKDASKVFDPERIELVAYIDEYKNNEAVQRTYLNTKTCDDKDYESFYEINGNEANYLYELRS